MNADKLNNKTTEYINNQEIYDKEELKTIIISLNKIIERQNSIIFSINNKYIILQNQLSYIKNQLNNYKKICDAIISKINYNPFSSLWFIHLLKKKVKGFYNED